MWAAQLDNVSHALFWSRSDAVDGEFASLSLIEFPRLGLAFSPRRDSDGVVRMFSHEHPSLFVCDEPPVVVQEHCASLPFHAILSDASRQYHILVPNYPVHSPQVRIGPHAVHAGHCCTRGRQFPGALSNAPLTDASSLCPIPCR